MDQHKLLKILRVGNTRSSNLSPEKSVYESRSKLEPYVEQLTGSKLGKEYNKAVYCLPPYLTWASLVAQLVKNLLAMQETWVRSLGWEDPLEKRKLLTPVFLPGEFPGL